MWFLRAKNACNLLIYFLALSGMAVVFFPSPERTEAYASVLQAMAYVLVPWMAAIFGGRWLDSKGNTYQNGKEVEVVQPAGTTNGEQVS